MEIFLAAVVPAALGLFLANRSSYLFSITLEDINNGDFDYETTRKLHKLKLDHYEYSAAFAAVETFLYIISAVLIAAGFFTIFRNMLAPIASAVVFGSAIIIVRTFAFAAGFRYSKKFGMKNVGSLLGPASLIKPIAATIAKTNQALAGSRAEEQSRDEINVLVESAREDGSLDDDEYRIMKAVMKFGDVYVSDVMTPRTVIFSCNADMKVSEAANLPELRMFSRIPIWEGESIDDSAVGYVMSKDIFHAALHEDGDKALREFSREVRFIPERSPLDIALDLFLKRREHLFLVVDEYGGVEGLITMEDALETVIGEEIVDEKDKFVDLREIAKQKRDTRIDRIAGYAKSKRQS